MKLVRLEFEDTQTGWKLEPMEFNSDLNLLVGVSGAGKTKILRTIETLKGVATDMRQFMVFGIKWNVTLKDASGAEFNWIGEYDNKTVNLVMDSKPYIISEEITVNGRPVIRRQGSVLELNRNQIPIISPQFSSVPVYATEHGVKQIHAFFSGIVNNLVTANYFFVAATQELNPLLSVMKTENDLLNNNYLNVPSKLVLSKFIAPKLFEKVSKLFSSIFPSVMSLDISSEATQNYGEHYVLVVKEKGIRRAIRAIELSSGMNRTLHFIANAILYPDDTMSLIDDFENSLGVNCLNAVTDLLLEESHRHQFIITSHHPYIINNVNPKKWRIITRNGSTVSAHDATELHIPKSRNLAFLQLINHPFFAKGVSA